MIFLNLGVCCMWVNYCFPNIGTFVIVWVGFVVCCSIENLFDEDSTSNLLLCFVQFGAIAVTRVWFIFFQVSSFSDEVRSTFSYCVTTNYAFIDYRYRWLSSTTWVNIIIFLLQLSLLQYLLTTGKLIKNVWILCAIPQPLSLLLHYLLMNGKIIQN